MKRKQKWFIGILTLFGLSGVLLILLPIIVKQQAIEWFEQNGIDKASIGDININLFTGRLGIFDLQLKKNGTTPLRFWRLTADVDWWPLIRKRILIKNIWLYELDMLIEQDKQQVLRLGGITLPVTEPAPPENKTTAENMPATSWGVGLDVLGIKNSRLRIRSPQYTLDEEVRVNSLYVSDVLSWTPEHPAPINLDMLVNGNPVRIKSRVRAFQSNPDIVTTLEVSKLDLSLYAPISRLFGIEELAGIVSVNLDSNAVLQAMNSTTGNQVAIDIQADIELSDFKVRYGDLLIANQYFNYLGDATLQLPSSPGEMLVTSNGETTIDNLMVVTSPVAARYANLTWKGGVVVKAQDSQDAQKPLHIELNGTVGIRDLVIDDKQHNVNLATINKINMEGVSVALPAQVRLKSISIASLQALKPQSVSHAIPPEIKETTQTTSSTNDMLPVVDIANLHFDSIGYQLAPAILDLAAININGMRLYGKREKDGSFYVIDQMLASPAGDEVDGNEQTENVATSEAPDDKPDALQIKVGTINLASSSEVIFIDQSVTPEFKAVISPLSVVLKRIDNSDKKSITTVDMNAALSKGNAISIKGSVTPFADKRDIHLKGNIKALDLVFASPYANSAIGYFVKSGRLNSTLNIDVDKNYLNLESAFELQRLTLASADNDARMASTKSIGIPLGAALALMKDKNGNIKLDIPVQGDLSDPAFNLGPAIRSAGTEAVKKASVAYATLALQPYGAIILGAKLLSAATAMRLESVHFDPGMSEINQDARKYLDKIGALMTERPGINLTLCGVATIQDEAILKQQLQEKQKPTTSQAQKPDQKTDQKSPEQLQAEAKILLEKLHHLADMRGENVKGYLIKGGKIQADRFFDCQTAINREEGGVPEVALGL